MHTLHLIRLENAHYNLLRYEPDSQHSFYPDRSKIASSFQVIEVSNKPGRIVCSEAEIERLLALVLAHKTIKALYDQLDPSQEDPVMSLYKIECADQANDTAMTALVVAWSDYKAGKITWDRQ